ncbi:MAG: DNA translocase FtsK 4TM domain-containing protein [Planctomycetota bacterium]|jgi:hypothetical protein
MLILGLTLVLGVLTLLAGEAAYLDDGAQNPIFGFVAVLCRGIGGGIIALYALVLVWSGLIYFKGERIADVAPLGGRMFAAIAVTVGVSGALGIAQLDSAGELGTLVGRSLNHTLGGAVGFPVLLMLMLLGFHLAGQGAWTALREPVAVAAAGGAAASPHAAFGSLGVDDPAERRFTQEPPMPDDGDPTADERSFAVTQAMEEIERSQGVTIVDVEPEAEAEAEARPSIGEDVDTAPDPAPETEEAEVRDGLRSVADLLRAPPATPDVPERDEEDAHGLVPVPPTEIAHEDEEYEEEDEEEEDEDREELATATPDREEEEEAEYEEYEEDDEEVEDEEDEEAEYEEYEEDDEEVEDEEDEEVEDEDEAAEYEEYEEEDEEADEDEAEAETGFAKAAAAEDEEEDEQADGFAEADSDDPYARGGLLRRMQRRQVPAEDTADDDRAYTTFDWRGRPVD